MKNTTIDDEKTIIERKIRYDSTISEYTCQLLKREHSNTILLHKIEEPFSMKAAQTEITIKQGCYTFAYYWQDKPYNLYFWRDAAGNYIGSYFNIVKNTIITENIVSFEDLIIDVLVLPNGDYFILDENELPDSLQQFEDGYVYDALHSLLPAMDTILENIKLETSNLYKTIFLD